MTVEMFAAVTGLIAVVLAGLQWWFAHQAASRQRDAEMTRWAWDVIDLMAELETVCAPISTDKPDVAQAELLGHRASALVDKGRLFFPNVKQFTLLDRATVFFLRGARANRDDDGIRVRVLDEVLRACYVARYLAANPSAGGQTLREQVWSARRSFVTLLQGEMGKSLRRVDRGQMGDYILPDPTTWSPPKHDLNLPTATSDGAAMR